MPLGQSIDLLDGIKATHTLAKDDITVATVKRAEG